jgi:hypothetical protein
MEHPKGEVMAYKLKIVENAMGINFDCKYENLSKHVRPDVEAKAPDGSIVKEKTTFQGQVLGPGATNRQWVDDAGNIYQKGQLKFFYEGQEVSENQQTKVFTITGYQSVKNYTDNYVIASYYETFPHDNDMKKDFDKEVARKTNLRGMKALWEHLRKTNQVARGEFCPSSKGFVASDGYLRAVEFGNKWAIELGVFKEEKLFEHLNENVPIEVPIATASPTRKLKMV